MTKILLLLEKGIDTDSLCSAHQDKDVSNKKCGYE